MTPPTTPIPDSSTQFKITPSSQELDSIQRDLRFIPSSYSPLKSLSIEQQKQFNREGYLKPFRIFSNEEMAGIRKYFDDLLAKYIAEGKDSYSISSAHLRHGKVWDILTNPRIVALVSDLLGDNVVAWGSHFFCKMPGDGKQVSWHQDASYWPLTPSRAITVWLAIDDADRENACMKYIPGSHHHGHLTFHLSENSESNILDQTVTNAEGIGEPIYVELAAGTASIHSDLLLHGSEVNQSTRRRCGLTLRYTTLDVTAHMGWNEKGVIVRCGNLERDELLKSDFKDPRGHWSNRPRPSED